VVPAVVDREGGDQRVMYQSACTEQQDKHGTLDRFGTQCVRGLLVKHSRLMELTSTATQRRSTVAFNTEEDVPAVKGPMRWPKCLCSSAISGDL
jgi:hypothetical protein